MNGLRPQRKGDKTTSTRDWVLDSQQLEKLFNSKTKLIVVNTPHNPIGKVYTTEELTVIADLCKKWNALCVSDEVYEWMVYKPNKHVRMGWYLNLVGISLSKEVLKNSLSLSSLTSRNVGEDDYDWLSGKILQRDWVESRMGIRSCRANQKSSSGPSELDIFVCLHRPGSRCYRTGKRIRGSRHARVLL